MQDRRNIKENFISSVLWKILTKTSNRVENIKEYYGLEKFLQEKIAPEFDYKLYLKSKNPYFSHYGFNVSMLESEYYSVASGKKSSLYVPWGIWQYFIYPYLNRDSWRWPYTDKNMFSRILGFEKVVTHVKVRMPETIVGMINGVLYDAQENQINEQQAYDNIVKYHGGLIYKPSVETHQGHGVRKIVINSFQDFRELCLNGGGNFIIQEEIMQHPDMASFNPSSVNTIRICTFRNFENKYKVLYATQRFGGNGSIFDNASSGGGFVGIESDGTIMRTSHKFHTLKTWQLPSYIPTKVPSYNLIKEAVLYMHTRLPQFQIIAWDMAVDINGIPVMIEYNLKQSTELCQMVHGPLFPKEELDEIMKRVANYSINLYYSAVVSFPDKKGYTLRR